MDQQAISLSNTAVSLLEEGRYGEAASSLRQALEASKQIVQKSQHNPEEQQKVSSPNNDSNEGGILQNHSNFSLDECMIKSLSCSDNIHQNTTTSKNIHSSIKTYPCTETGDDTDIEYSAGGNQCSTEAAVTSTTALHYSQDRPFLYGKAIWIPSSAASEIDLLDSSVLISIIVLFNLALTYHLRAVATTSNSTSNTNNQRASGGDRSTALLLKTVKLYELALQMHDSSQHEVHGVGSSPIYVMACVNNLGLIHQTLGDFESSDRYFQYLLQLHMAMVDFCRYQAGGDDDGQEIMFVLSALLDGFLLNATQRICPPTIAGAA